MGGLFYLLPPFNQPIPAPQTPKDPVLVNCSPTLLRLAPSAQGAFSCEVKSQNGFFGTLSVMCEQIKRPSLEVVAEPNCSVGPTLELTPGGTASIYGVVTMPANADRNSGEILFLALGLAGKQLQAPNEISTVPVLPPDPPPVLSFTCKATEQTTVATQNGAMPALLGNCTLHVVSAPSFLNPGVAFDSVIAPTPTATASPAPPGGGQQQPVRLYECWGGTRDEVVANQAAYYCNPGKILSSPSGQSSTVWFSIPLDQLTPGRWTFPINAREGGTTVTVQLTFQMQADGTTTGWP